MTGQFFYFFLSIWYFNKQLWLALSCPCRPGWLKIIAFFLSWSLPDCWKYSHEHYKQLLPPDIVYVINSKLGTSIIFPKFFKFIDGSFLLLWENTLTQSNSKEGFISDPSSRLQSVIAGRSQWQKLRSWSHAQPRAEREREREYFQTGSSHNNENYQDNPDLHSPSLRLSLGDPN